MENQLFDTLVIGGGPAGCSAAIYAARARFTTLVIDKDPLAGALGMAHKIANYPGIPEALTGAELLAMMRRQAEQFGALFERDKVTGIVFGSGSHQVFTASGKTWTARAIILATGAMGRSGEVPGEKRLLGKGVSYCATCDAPFYKGRVVAVYGNTAEAVEESMLLLRFASKVMLLVPGGALHFPEGVSGLSLEDSGIEIRYNAAVTSINGERAVESLSIRGSAETLAVEGVFIYLTGSAPVLDYLGGQLEVRAEGCLKVDQEQAASVPGVFAAGDVLCRDVKQAVIVAAEGCVAALHAGMYLTGRTRPGRDYS